MVWIIIVFIGVFSTFLLLNALYKKTNAYKNATLMYTDFAISNSKKKL